jgi:hypothetical protein
MDIPNLGANFSMVREHLQLFATLLFALPLISFLSVRIWLAARASKVQRTTNWFVPTDLESDAARMHYAIGRNSAAFAHQARSDARATATARNSKMRRRA